MAQQQKFVTRTGQGTVHLLLGILTKVIRVKEQKEKNGSLTARELTALKDDFRVMTYLRLAGRSIGHHNGNGKGGATKRKAKPRRRVSR